MAESEEELKSLLMKVKEEREKAGLKLNIHKTKIMASGPITSWQIDGETETEFIFGGSKITADGDCSHEIKRHFLLGRKAMTNLDSILKSRDITLPTKVRLVKAMVFPVVMYECESWTIKKVKVKVKLLSRVRLFTAPWTAWSTRLLCPWDFPGKSTGVGCHFLLQIKKAECQKIDAFELWCWRKTLESPLDCKEIQPVNPEGSQS